MRQEISICVFSTIPRIFSDMGKGIRQYGTSGSFLLFAGMAAFLS
jgi:hypothetical protein